MNEVKCHFVDKSLFTLGSESRVCNCVPCPYKAVDSLVKEYKVSPSIKLIVNTRLDEDKSVLFYFEVKKQDPIEIVGESIKSILNDLTVK